MIDQLKLTFRGDYHPPAWLRIEADCKMNFEKTA
jgi:hypothetical protein